MEVLVVISVAAILVAILFPVFVSAKRRALQTACLSNESQVGKAIMLYSGDSDDLFPFAVDATDKYASQIWDDHPDWQAEISTMPLLSDALAQYVTRTAAFHCPADTGFTVLDNAYPTALNAQPSSFSTFGLSYVYRTELAFRHVAQSELQGPAAINLIADSAGDWHTRESALVVSDNGEQAVAKLHKYRYNTVFGDLHAKSISRRDMNLAFAQSP